METPVEIDFQGTEPSDFARDLIRQHMASLEKHFGRVTAGRVVVKGTGEHHRQGSPYEVHLQLSLPAGRMVSVDRTRNADERHADVAFAVSDAFKRARRQLQDQIRRLRGDVKTHRERGAGAGGTNEP